MTDFISISDNTIAFYKRRILAKEAEIKAYQQKHAQHQAKRNFIRAQAHSHYEVNGLQNYEAKPPSVWRRGFDGIMEQTGTKYSEDEVKIFHAMWYDTTHCGNHSYRRCVTCSRNYCYYDDSCPCKQAKFYDNLTEQARDEYKDTHYLQCIATLKAHIRSEEKEVAKYEAKII